MTSAAQKSGASQSVNPSARSFFLGKFFLGWVALVVTLVASGIGGFWSLSSSGPLTLIQGAERPIAAATAFVPAKSPFTLSLLTRPDNLVALQQAIAATASSSAHPTSSSRTSPSRTSPSRPNPPLDPQQRNRREIAQLKQSLLENTGLDYDRDLQPWLGEEVTFAFTSQDLDQEAANGQQSGYLLALEIDPAHQPQAREFLQLFWQRQSLAGNSPTSEQISGVRVLYSAQKGAQNSLQKRPSALTSASALVGDRFVMFANDVRVLRQSILAAQSGMNLAQNRAYRQTVAQLPERRIGLAYLDLASLNLARSNNDSKITSATSPLDSFGQTQTPHAFVAIGLGLTPSGLTADIRSASTAQAAAQPATEARRKAKRDPDQTLSGDSMPVEAIKALKFLPANTALALASHNLAQLEPALAAVGVSEGALPVLFQLDKAVVQDWASADYALGQLTVGTDKDWILAIAPDGAERRADGIARLDAAAQAKGYSVVPVAMGDREVIAWTRFKSGTRGRSGSNALETEILGLHLQQDAYEIFAGSLAAMESALAAPTQPLLKSARFEQAIAELSPTDSGYLYTDWSAIEPALSRAVPILRRIEEAARPWVSHIDTLAATREGDAASVFIRLAP